MKINLTIMIFLVAVLLGNIFLNCSARIKKNTATENTINAGIPKEEFTGNSISDVDNPEKIVGEYNADISNFKATITIFIRNNKFYGEIKFENWGNGLPQPLKDLNITDNKIYFVRSVSTDQELKKFNSNRFFKQQYHGTFSKDQKQIKGYYVEAGAEASWRAYKE